MHSLRCDATNAKIWHKRKLHVFEADSVYFIRWPADMGVEEPHRCFAESMFLGDLLVVNQGSGKATRSMILKQGKSCGLPMWPQALKDEAIPRTDGEEPSINIYNELMRQNVVHRLTGKKMKIHAYCQTTDAGTDQVGCKNLIAKEVACCLFVLHLTTNCFQHRGHLGYMRLLLMCEWCMRYLGAVINLYSSLAKIVNVWREIGEVVHNSAIAIFGPEFADRTTKKCPPKCVKHRWGSEFMTSAHLVKSEIDKVCKVFDVALKR